ncbi:GntR family transcriptional regulator [Alicyclobacillus curvatus]|nr:GntR family transcriptional regulator [Alicyclobacillus curvatus]
MEMPMDKYTSQDGFVLDPQRSVPLYHQLKDFLKFEAENGRLADATGKLPTEAELAKRFKVSRITVRSALRYLEEQGLVSRERGRGTFLNTNEVENWRGRLLGFTEAIKAAGYEPDSRIIRKGFTKNFPSNVREALMTDEVWELKRLRLADKNPIAIEHAYFPSQIGLLLNDEDVNSLPLYRYIETNLNIILHEGKQIISALSAGQEESEILDVNEGEAMLSVERVTFSVDGEVVEFLDAIYRPDYFQYTIWLTR